MLDDEGFRRRAGRTWPASSPELRVVAGLQPLVEFCRAPRRAPDLVDPDQAKRLRRRLGTEFLEPYGWKHELQIALNHLKAGGPVLLARKAWRRAGRKWTGR